MRMGYDSKVEAFYLRLTDGKTHDSDEMADGVIVDYDDAGKVIGFEILDFKERLAEAQADSEARHRTE